MKPVLIGCQYGLFLCSFFFLLILERFHKQIAQSLRWDFCPTLGGVLFREGVAPVVVLLFAYLAAAQLFRLFCPCGKHGKENIIKTKLLPYFGKRKINEITTKDVIAWQNELLAYRDEKRKPYSQTYLKTLHNQLSAIFNHAVRFYDLHSNPAAKAGNMGTEERREMLFWTKEEYQKFAEEMMDKPVSYYAFQMLYWTGIREGELLALTPADFDFERGTVKISKTYQRLKGQDVITSPKTKKSNRTIQMPDFLCQEMQEFFKMQYGLKKKDRIFTVTKSYLHQEMDRGAKAAGVKRIRIHDLRHSHISLLIDMGFSAVAIADRVGHESIEITYRYAHLFPSKQKEMASRLDDLGKGV